jgi:hypothetical protein
MKVDNAGVWMYSAAVQMFTDPHSNVYIKFFIQKA